MINDKCEAFDWAWALWSWFSHHHEGQNCPKYAAMNIAHDYDMTNIPSIDFDNNNCDEYDMAVEYYHQINEDNWEEHLKEFRNYMDNKYDLED
jgi:hypothetical protein